MLHERDMKIMLTKVSNTSWMFNTSHYEDRMLLMGSTTIHRDFHEDGIPQLCEQGDSIGQAKDIMV
jgi:hypothetical protein